MLYFTNKSPGTSSAVPIVKTRMARHPEKTKSRSSIFPVKFRGFVKDVKSFTKEFRLERKSQDLEPPAKPIEPLVERQAESLVEIPPSPTVVSTPLYTANLNVQVSLRFDEPLDFSYSRKYEGSPSLVVTERLCQGLLQRIDHCSQELLTRKDANALQRTRNNGIGKSVRFELRIQINRGSETWAARTFTSYQKQPLTAEAAREVSLETHYMIGLFLRHHDDGFVLKDGPIRDDPSQSPKAHPFRPGRVQPMSCVPRSYFLQSSQNFESIPGYTIHLRTTIRDHRRKPSEWQNTVEVNSQQTTPLNLAVAESLFFEASQAMENVLRVERDSFEERHRSCTQPDGCSYWRQHEGDGFELELTVRNNLGPRFEHLRRTVSSSIALLSHLRAGVDCDKFVNNIEQAFTGIRDGTDEKVKSMNDLEFRIIELRGRGWTLEEPLLFTIGPASTYSRRNTEAVLDRVQAGIADILRKNAMAVRMTAYKRGHLVLDKTLVAREPLDQPESRRKKLHKTSQENVLGRLRERIEKDIGLICKDSCSLSGSDYDVQVPDGTAPKCVPADDDESGGTLSPPRSSAESALGPDSTKTLTSGYGAGSIRDGEPDLPPPSSSSSLDTRQASARREAPNAINYPPDPPTAESAEAHNADNADGRAETGSRQEHSPRQPPSPTGSGYLSKGRTAFPRLGKDGARASSTAGTTPTATPSLHFSEEPTPRSSHEARRHAHERPAAAAALGIETEFCGDAVVRGGGGSSSSSASSSSSSSSSSSDTEDGMGGDDQGGFSRPSLFIPGKTHLPSLGRWPSKPSNTALSPLHQGHSALEDTTTTTTAPEGPEKPPQESVLSESRGDVVVKKQLSISEYSSSNYSVSEPPRDDGDDGVVVDHNSTTDRPSATPELKAEAEAEAETEVGAAGAGVEVAEVAGTTTDPGDRANEYELALRCLEADSFSQSRLDFDFSSAATSTHGGGSSPVDDLSEADEWGESSLSSPRPPPAKDPSSHQQAQRRSFGSAGFLGMHEEKIVQVSLRRALMGSPSRGGR